MGEDDTGAGGERSDGCEKGVSQRYTLRFWKLVEIVGYLVGVQWSGTCDKGVGRE